MSRVTLTLSPSSSLCRPSNDPNVVVDSDHYLDRLQIILKGIHDDFYASYDQWMQDKTRDMPDVKQILPDMRRGVLKGLSLCFSHLMPQGYPLEKHRATVIARAMGASVTPDLQVDDRGTCLSTHVIAGKQTSKVERAIKFNIHVVTPEWLIDCYEQWERKQENEYVLHQSYDVRKSRLFTRENPRFGKQIASFSTSVNSLLVAQEYTQANDRGSSPRQKVRQTSISDSDDRGSISAAQLVGRRASLQFDDEQA